MTWLDELDGLTAAQVVHQRLSSLPASTTVGELRAYFAESTSRRLALLVDDRRYVGAVMADALPADANADAPAGDFAAPGETIAASAPARAAADLALTMPSQRLPVVEDDGTLVGVVAINRARDGLCGI